MKRFLSLFLSVAMLSSLIVIPTTNVSAATSYQDYVPGEMPPNMLKTVTEIGGSSSAWSSWWVQMGTTTSGRISRSYTNSYKGTSITANGTAGELMSGAAPSDSAMTNGLYINSPLINGNNFVKADGSTYDGDLAGGKSYVFKMQVRNANADIIPNIHVRLYDRDGVGGSQYTKEHGSAGMAVTSTEWMDLKGTIYNADDSTASHTINDRDMISIGFPTSTTYAGSSVEINFTDESTGMYRMYLAEEVAYNITNELTSDTSVVTSNNSATFKAEVTNQIGNPGYLDQTFTWMALDTATRTTEIEGVVITPSDDTTTATVSVTADVDPGTYDIVAYSQAYDMAKGYTITVDVPSKYIDYVPGEKPANLIDSQSSKNSGMLQYFTQTNTNVVKVSWDSYTHIKVTSQVAYDGTTKVGRAGYYMPGAWVHSMIMPADTIENEKNYVINYYAKAGTGLDGTVRDTYTNAGITNYRNEYKLLTTKEYGTQGMPVSEDWKEFKGTIYVEPIHSSYADQRASELALGLSTQAPAGTGVVISDGLNGEPGKVYFAEEIVYDITNTLVSGSSTVEYGDTLKFKAEVVNQIGIPGYLSQNFTWKALDKATRKLQADGITVTPSKDTTEATVSIGADVPEGEYAIVAYSEDYNIAKGFVITVETADISADYVPGTKPANLMPDNTNPNNFTGRWLYTFLTIAPTHTGGVAGAMRYPIEVARTEDGVNKPQYWGDSSAYAVAGGELTDTVNNNTGIGNGLYTWKANTNYVISTDLMNAPDATVKNSKFVYQMYAKDSDGNIGRPYKMLDITSDSDWQTFKFVLHNEYAGDESTRLFYGYPNHSSLQNPQGTEIRHRLGSFYIAEEKPYDINVTGADTALRAGEGSISFTAEVLNQLEIPFEGATNIEWYVMNEYRTRKVDGFNLTSDGNTVTISAPASTPYGKYVIVAEDNSLGVAGFRKGLEFILTPQDVDLNENEDALIYVAPNGDDGNYGTKRAPLATFEAALDKIDELKARDIEIAEVIFRGGDYRVNNVKVLEKHSGTADASLVFKSYPGEKAVFNGSVELDMSKAEHVTDTALLDRMYPSVHDKVVVIDLTGQGITQSEITELTEVNSIYALQNSTDYNTIYVDNVEQPIAQWPNGREYTTWTPIKTFSLSSLKYVTEPYQMGYSNGDNPDRWTSATQWWVGVFPDWDYTRYRLSPQSIDTSKNVIHYPEQTDVDANGNGTPVPELTSTVSRRWKAYNLLEEIDLPGEFYIDRANMKLYFYPPYEIEDDTKVEFSTVKTLLSVADAENIIFKDLHFTQNLSTAVTIKDVVNVDFDGCTFSNIGFKGIANSGSKKPITGANNWQQAFMYNDASYNCDITNCVFDNCGGVSIQIVGGNADTLTPSGNIIENNIITRSNQRSMVDSALSVAGVGNTVRNNNISKSTQHAISMYGNDHRIEKNEIHNVLREVADAGAIYQGRNQMQRGSTISTNLIHDIWPTDSRLTTGTVGVYMDDAHQGNTIANNFFIGTKTGYNSHGAAAQKVLNNIMVDTNAPWMFHDNPNSSTETIAKGGESDWDMKDGVADKVRSTMYDVDKHTDTMDTFLSEIENLELYRERYPDLASWIDTNDNPHKYTVFSGNVSVNATADTSNENLLCWDDRTFAQIGTNPVDYTKDIFVDPDSLDYRVKSTSEAAIANPGLLSDANFDMDWVGVQNSFVLNNTTAPFKLLYPTADEPVGTAVELYWEDALLANRYDIIVATDAGFKNIVENVEVHNNIHELSGLTAGTRYYWKVIAKNTSRDFGSTWESDVATFFVSDITLTNTALKTGENTVSFDMNVSSSNSYDATVYTLAYDNEGNMKAIDKQDKTISSAAQKLTVSIDTKGEFAIDYVKILVWKKGDVTPLRAAKILKK